MVSQVENSLKTGQFISITIISIAEFTIVCIWLYNNSRLYCYLTLRNLVIRIIYHEKVNLA